MGVQVLDSDEPHVPHSSSIDEPVVGTSGVAGPSRLAPAFSSSNTQDEAEVILGNSSGTSGRRMNSEELKARWNWRKIFSKLGTQEQCIQFAEDRDLLLKRKWCSYHKRWMSLSTASGQVGRFRCYKSNCREQTRSRAIGTWFENARLPLTRLFELMYAFSAGLSYLQAVHELATENSVVSYSTVTDWYSYCRETIVVFEIENQITRPKIGGSGKIVHIDESKCGVRKLNRGHQIDGHWVIAMIEDRRDDLRLEVCPENVQSAEVLPLIMKHVEVGSTVHTDYWQAYTSLSDHGYTHIRVNHIDPENRFVATDGTHTQGIESQWRGLKKSLRQHKNKQDFTDRLFEYTWRRRIRINNMDPFEELLKAVQHVYKVIR
ncbi:uncharacterized protein LOC106718460 [Papilio machaon]|uniref:uncharacterized protein LOC106718460 n=1 Tax=Papilio machaon TaxID=76193 RepID=UPI001E6644C3|nr:uncharacterized protein LOC106718460 [Papilio machaon]